MIAPLYGTVVEHGCCSRVAWEWGVHTIGKIAYSTSRGIREL